MSDATPTVAEKPNVPPAPMSVADVWSALKAPFDPEHVRWRVQKLLNDGTAICVPYIDARAVSGRLNRVLGLDGWQTRTRRYPDGLVRCRLMMRFPTRPTEWISREDVGTPSDQPDAGDKIKAAFSDALKRVAVHFGIGAYLYQLKTMKLKADKYTVLEVPRLPNFALPRDRQTITPKEVATIEGLVKSLCGETKENWTEYMTRSITAMGYDPKQTVSQFERRHYTALLQQVNRHMEDVAKKSATGGEEKIPDKYPQSGAELRSRLAEMDSKLAKSKAIPAVGSLIADMIQWGTKQGFGAIMGDWKGRQIIAATEEISRRIKALEKSTAA